MTTWNYDSQRGWLNSKAYADGHGPSYTYTPAGRLQSRAWVRTDGSGNPITTTNSYDAAGGLTNILYSDTTPSVTNSYDRLGRLTQQTTVNYQLNSTYNLAGELLTESWSGGPLNGLSVTNGYDQFLRRTNLSTLNSPSAILTRTAYGYDNASRLSTVNDGNNNSATYWYLANSPLVSQIAFKQNGATRMTTSKQYDDLNRLTGISSQPGGTGVSPVSFNYSYNAANQRTQDKLADGSYWVYNYDSLGQVVGGHKYFYNGTPVPGQQFDYGFDTIGNRTQTKAGGDQTGGNQRLASYSVNNLNQITSRDYPGTNDIVGVALATNTVTVNGQTAFRKGEYFWQTVQTNNTASPAWLTATVASGGNGSTGSLYMAQTPEQFSYDSDGNLTNDGRWAYSWDAENRLIGMAVNTNVGPQYQLAFAYDATGRRIQKMVTNGLAVSTVNFLYDGWNVVAELQPHNTLIRSYVWGSDLSGSVQGAGGVGGLLEVSYSGTSTTNCFPAFDGNGNVAALVNAADGTSLATYEYGPFGEVVRATGPMAKLNPFRFSTKYQDDESDLVYYDRRYLKTSTGGWLSRDPMDELGSMLMTEDAVDDDGDSENDGNLYRFVNNDPIGQTDALGLWPSSSPFLGFLINGHAIPLTHQNANQASLPISGGDLIIVDAATKFVDTFQKTGDSYMHAMKAPGQDGGAAKVLANAFVKTHLIAAESKLCGCQGDRDSALFDFGMALHTVQDSTSPAHNTPQNEFKTWDGTIHWIKALRHVKHEDFDPGPGSALYRATADFWKYFQCINSAPTLPDNFFTWGTDQNPNGK